MNRRNFLKSSCLLSTALLTSCNSSFNLNYEIELVSLDIKSNKIPKNFNNYKILFLTDLHYGETFNHQWLEDIILKANQIKPDLLLLGGDYINVPRSLVAKLINLKRNTHLNKIDLINKYENFLSILFENLSKIKSIKNVLGVFGNHERWLCSDLTRSLFKKFDFKLLENEQKKIYLNNQFINILGVDDFITGNPKFLKANTSNFNLLINHNPDYISNLSKYNKNIYDLILSGHTHGGQIKLPVIGAIKTNLNNNKYFEGLNYLDSTPCYTSRGVGVVEIPIRVNCPPEMTLINLVKT